MVAARRLFRRPSRRRWSWAAVVVGNPRDYFVFLVLLGFYLQIIDNHSISVRLSVSICVASCNFFSINEIRGCSPKKTSKNMYRDGVI
jgi:hypothetical protein